MRQRIKKAFTCKNVEHFFLNEPLADAHVPQIGDVAVFKVIKANGGYVLDENSQSRTLFEGDLVMLAFGNRYATSQLEGYVPESPTRMCSLIGRGGVAGVLKSMNSTMKKEPALLEIVAFATDEFGQVINTINREELRPFNPYTINSKVILSIGSSMDSGKTTSAAFLCGGLTLAGRTNAYIKLTGTAYPKDAAFVYDRGADFVADFTHFGYPSTFLCSQDEIMDLYQSLVDFVYEKCQPEFIVVEIADGILQRETAFLLNNAQFMSTIHGVLFSCGDSLGVQTGLNLLKKHGIEPFAVSGLFTASDLLIQEVVHSVDVPVLTLAELLAGKALDYLPVYDDKMLIHD